jgi:glycosyltransferase involved in cell wall biosynthesis
VDELELELLYQNAYSFLYPTLNEGFGYPPLESMKYGTPVLCSAITSITELCGDAVLYFNPFSVDEIKNRILLVLFEEGIWEQYSLLGIERSHLIASKQDRMLDALCRLILAP